MRGKGRKIATKILVTFMVANILFSNVVTVYAHETGVYVQQNVTELEEDVALEEDTELEMDAYPSTRGIAPIPSYFLLWGSALHSFILRNF